MFGKKPQIKPPVTEQKITLPPKFSEDIRTIPSAFQQTSTQKSNKIFIIVGIAVILLGLTGVSALLVYKSMVNQNKPSADLNQPLANQNVNQPPVTNANVDVGVNANANSVNANVNANASTNVNANPDLNLNTNTNINAAAPAGASDTDNDQLTLAEEEKIYSTNASNYDTDGDGYWDGSEVLAGFSPAASNQSLLDSGLISVYDSADLQFEAWYPQNWFVSRTVIPGGAKISFDSKTGEIIEIFVTPGAANQTLNQWIATSYSNVNINELQAVNLKNFSGLMSADGLRYFLQNSRSSKLFMVNYETGGVSALSFSTTFKMMLGSLNIK